jgi:hypothetical protein
LKKWKIRNVKNILPTKSKKGKQHTEMTAAVAYIVANQLSGPALSLTIGKLADLLMSLGNKQDDVVQKAHNEITRVVPFVKLKIVHAMVSDFEDLRRRSKTVDAIMDGLNESADDIYRSLTMVKLAANEYEALWFRSWRTHLFNVEPELTRIRTSADRLDRGFQLLIDLLPSCATIFPSSSSSSSSISNANDCQLVRLPAPTAVVVLADDSAAKPVSSSSSASLSAFEMVEPGAPASTSECAVVHPPKTAIKAKAD